jgi:hypothetical protein
MVKLNLSKQEELLMKKVCEIQLDSFEKILSGENEVDVTEKLREHKLSEVELKNMIHEVVRQYRMISERPDSLFGSHSDLLGNFRDALDFNTDYLPGFDSLIPKMLSKLDCAIFVLRHQN